MRELKFKDSEEAFLGINGYLIFNAEGVEENGVVMKSQAIMYDTIVDIHQSRIPPTWDFTASVNYRSAKWTSLVNNYVDRHHLQEVVAEVQSRELKKSSAYNVSFLFSNSHGGGKGCLLSCTFSRRPGKAAPTLIVAIRASEVYKRLMMDLLLLHRIGEEAYGEEADFSIRIFMPHAWQGASWAAMFLTLISTETIEAYEESFGTNPFWEAVKEKFKYFKEADWSKFSYNADKRAAKVIQGDVASPPLLAKDCNI